MHLWERLRYWYSAFGPVGKALEVAYSGFGFLLFLREVIPDAAQNDLHVAAILSYLPRWSLSQWIFGALLIALGGFLEGSYRFDRRRQDVIESLRAVPSQKYATTCLIYDDLLVLLSDEGADFYDRCNTWWGDVNERLFPYLHEHERIRLRELFNHPSAWKKSGLDGTYDPSTDMRIGSTGLAVMTGSDAKNSKAALHGLKNELGSWMNRDAPIMPPNPQSTLSIVVPPSTTGGA